MNILERIDADFKTAFKAGDKVKKDFLGVIKGEIQNAKGRGVEPTDENVIKVLKAMEKSLNQTLEAKPDSEEDKASLEIVKGYLPEQMSDDKILEEVKSIIDAGANNIGSIMKEFNSKFAGLADNKTVSKIAGEALKK